MTILKILPSDKKLNMERSRKLQVTSIHKPMRQIKVIVILFIEQYLLILRYLNMRLNPQMKDMKSITTWSQSIICNVTGKWSWVFTGCKVQHQCYYILTTWCGSMAVMQGREGPGHHGRRWRSGAGQDFTRPRRCSLNNHHLCHHCTRGMCRGPFAPRMIIAYIWMNTMNLS